MVGIPINSMDQAYTAIPFLQVISNYIRTDALLVQIFCHNKSILNRIVVHFNSHISDTKFKINIVDISTKVDNPNSNIETGNLAYARNLIDYEAFFSSNSVSLLIGFASSQSELENLDLTAASFAAASNNIPFILADAGRYHYGSSYRWRTTRNQLSASYVAALYKTSTIITVATKNALNHLIAEGNNQLPESLIMTTELKSFKI